MRRVTRAGYGIGSQTVITIAGRRYPMSKTRVVQVSRPTGPLELVERDVPDPAAGHVRLQVQACGETVALIPAERSAVEAAPLMCAGVTTFNALRNSAAGAGDLVAVLGLGGLGHLGVQFAAKMGFRTVAIARGKDKGSLARELA